MQNAGYIGYTGASSTAVSVIADIAESIDVSGLVDVSGTSLDNILAKVILSNTALDTIATNVLTASAVSVGGTVTTAAPINQNVSGISLDAIKVATAAIQTDIAANEVLLTAIDAVLDTIKIDTEAIETAVEGTLDVALQPSKDSYLSHVYIDLDATGDNPATNTEVVAAPGSGNKLVIYGVQGSIVGSAAAAAGNWYLSDGNTSAATTLWTGRAQGITNTQFELTFPYGVALTANTALKLTSTEAANHIFINAVVYYRTEAV